MSGQDNNRAATGFAGTGSDLLGSFGCARGMRDERAGNAETTGLCRPGHLQRCGLGCGPLDRLLVEDSAAVCTDLLLDLVRDAGTLQKHMNTLCDVLVDLGRGLCAHLH
jgi:hypothetical protein